MSKEKQNENKSNNFDVKSNEELFKQALVEGVNRHIDKTIEEAKKIEQIDEMGKVIAKADDTCLCRTIAEALYKAGYRKKSEGEWKKPSRYSEHICTICKKSPCQYFGMLPPYCPNCGAKMKGGK